MSIPEPPDFVKSNKDALAEWNRIMPILQERQVLNKLDQSALAILCKEWGCYREADRQIDEKGQVYKTPKGWLVKNAWCSAKNDAYKKWEKLADQFGLMPVSRNRLKVEPTKSKTNPKAKFFEEAE